MTTGVEVVPEDMFLNLDMRLEEIEKDVLNRMWLCDGTGPGLYAWGV